MPFTFFHVYYIAITDLYNKMIGEDLESLQLVYNSKERY